MTFYSRPELAVVVVIVVALIGAAALAFACWRIQPDTPDEDNE